MALLIRKVLITDDVDPICIQILQETGIEVTVSTSFAKDKAAFLAAIPNYDGLVVRSATKVSADVINASNLHIIGRAGTGVDNIDCDAATRKGVVVMNTPGGNTLSAAELTCAMICSLARSVPAASQSMKEGRWDRKLFMGEELFGKTLAVIGLGRIGREVANRMRSFGMTTIGYDPLVSAADSAKFGVAFYQLEDIWGVADYITVHVPLIPQTANLINKAVFSKCKRGVKVINCARGGIIDEAALLDALRLGQCGGAGLDVFLEEPTKNLALIQHPCVVSTPHLGANTTEAQGRVAEEIARQFVDAASGKALFGAVNAEALTSALNPSNGPWIFLAKAIGRIAAEVRGQSAIPAEVTVKVSGGDAGKNMLRFLSAAVLAGLLKNKTNNGLNLVNSPSLAKDMGVKVSSVYEQTADANSAVSVHLDGFIVAGTVNGTQPLLLALGPSSFAGNGAVLRPESQLILYRSTANAQPLPSIIGSLAEVGINVLSFARSTDKVSSEAWGLIEVDQLPAQTECQLPHVTLLRHIALSF